jgi:hypothetical protein
MKQPKSLDADAPFRQAIKQAQKATQINDPLNWVQTALPSVYLWSKQREILEALTVHNRVAVRACHDSSKSFTAAIAAARWLDVHPIGQARVITTAPTAMQVKGILWVELNQLHANYDLPGRMNQTEWWIGSYLAGVGRKPSDYNPAAFQGMHARYMLIIIDEASGVPNALIDAAETLATNVHARILMIGNPDDPASLFAQIHNDPIKHGYHTIKISAWDTPNFTDEGNPDKQDPITGRPFPNELREVLLSTEWVEARRKAWGEQHPFWLSKVEAEFPPIDTSSVIKLHDLIKARIPFSERANKPPSEVSAIPQTSATVLGVDVAGSDTGDETVIRLVTTHSNTSTTNNIHQLHKPTVEWRARTADPIEVTDHIVRAIITTMPSQVIIDSIGVGFGILASVKQHEAIQSLPANKQPTITGFNASQAPHSKEYGNQRAELWWTARTLFQDGMIDTSQADNQMDLEAQLLQPRYFIKKGKIWIEAKEDIKSRIGRSPDNADAFLYALWPSMRSTQIAITPPPRNVQLYQRHSHPAISQATRLVKQR